MLPIAVDAMGGDQAPRDPRRAPRCRRRRSASPSSSSAARRRRRLTRVTSTSSRRGHRDGRRPRARACAARRTRRWSAPPRPCATARRRRWSAPGNTGATMAGALLRMGRIRGVSRPAIATPLPVPGRDPDRAARRRRQRRVPAGVARAVRADGHGVLAAALRRGQPTGRAAVDRRGSVEGQLAS